MKIFFNFAKNVFYFSYVEYLREHENEWICIFPSFLEWETSERRG